MPDAPSAPNPIQGFVSAKNPADAIKFLQNSGLNKDQMYDLRQKMRLDDIAPGDFLLADNAWNAAEVLKKMDPKDFGKFKAQFGKRFNELNKTDSPQPVEKNLGRAFSSALGFQPKAEKPKQTQPKQVKTAQVPNPQASAQIEEPARAQIQTPTQAQAPAMRPQVQTGTGGTPKPRATQTGTSRPAQAPRAASSGLQTSGGQVAAGGAGQAGQQARPGDQNLGRVSTTGKRRIEQPGSQGPSAQAAISTKATQRTTPAEFTPGQAQIQSQTQIITPQTWVETPKVAINVPLAPTTEAAPRQSAAIRRTKREDFQIPTAIEAQEPGQELEEPEATSVPGQKLPEEVEAPRAMPPGTPLNIRTRATLPVDRMVNLGAQQYRARRGASPQDQRAQVMGERAPGESAPVLPDFEAPTQKSAYTSSPADMDIETGEGGGSVASDLEAIQQMQAIQQKARRAQMQATGHAPVDLAVDEFETPIQEEYETQSAELEGTEEEEEEHDGQDIVEDGPGVRGKFERFAAQIMRKRAQLDKTQAQQIAQTSADYNAASMMKRQKNLQNLWRMFEGSAALSFWGITIAVITANLQMINKYTFKVQWIPPTEIYEDLIILLMDLAIALLITITFTVQIIIIVLITIIAQNLFSPLF